MFVTIAYLEILYVNSRRYVYHLKWLPYFCDRISISNNKMRYINYDSRNLTSFFFLLTRVLLFVPYPPWYVVQPAKGLCGNLNESVSELHGGLPR